MDTLEALENTLTVSEALKIDPALSVLSEAEIREAINVIDNLVDIAFDFRNGAGSKNPAKVVY